MTKLTLPELAKKMRSIDFAMLSTHTDNGEIAARPMSNNADVEYDGDSYYFAWEHSRMTRDIENHAQVSLSFQGGAGLLGKPPLFIAVEGRAEVVRDKLAFAEHWQSEMERWFENGVDTPGLVMLKVRATRIRYWNSEDEGEILI